MRRLIAWVLALLLAAALAGCASMPTDGPVVETESDELTPSGAGAPFIDPLPPREGASRPEVVRGFINAMQAWPSQTATAEEFLTEDAAAAWQPQDATITYPVTPNPRDEGRDVSIVLPDAHHLDSRGSWQGKLPVRQRTVTYPMVFEDGEWRIDAVPNALMVPESWFTDRYRQVSLYFFDPTVSILTPEPIFVPRGDQLATTLTQSLLMGPGPGLQRVEQSFVPPGLDVAVGVTVSDDGVADILLTGDPGQLSANTVELMMVQFGWTLRQEPKIESIQLSIGGQPVPLPGGVASYPVNSGPQFDPSGFQSNPLLYGLSQDRIVAGTEAAFTPVGGPLGERGLGLRSVGVSLEATAAAGVTEAGGSVVAAPLSDGATVRTVQFGTDFLRPAWDFSNRLWLVDRTEDGARVSYVDGAAGDEIGEPRTVRVPGITGERVRMFLISRDGTRLVAVVRRSGRDELVVSRIEHAAGGRVLGAVDAERIDIGDDSGLPIRDVVWRTSTTVAVLHSLTQSLAEVTPASVDGAPMNPEIAATAVDGRVVGLAGSPVPGESIYGLTRTGLIDIESADRRPNPFEERTTAIVYVG
ncbi:MAG: LpqB family beta-propeller domain-containing protein [Nocardioides sp.]